jgi:hypothetical protein
MNIEREERFNDFMRRNAAHFEHYCFQLFLWYPLPDGTWRLKFGRGLPSDYHLDVWEVEAVPEMAKEWGIRPEDIAPGLGDHAIPTGYVDFMEERGREYFVLIIPEQLPPGWTLAQLKAQLNCGDDINRVKRVERRNADPDAVANLIDTLEELQMYRSVES